MGGSYYIFNFFSKGFALANRSLEIYFITLALTTLSLINQFTPKLIGVEALSGLFSILITTIHFGFSLSIPLFLLQRQQNKSLDPKSVFLTTLQNTKRIILSVILIFLLFIALIIISVIILIPLNPNSQQITQFSQMIVGSNTRNPFFLFILPSLFSFLVFTSFFFSLERKGLLASIKDSILTSFKNLAYIIAVVTLGIISSLLISFLSYTEFWSSLLRSTIILYIDFVVLSSALFYYQKRVISSDPGSE